MYPYVKHLSPQKQCPQCSSHDVWYLSIWTLLDLMEQAVLAGGAMTTHVDNAIYLGSLWILIKFLRWRSNHCRGGVDLTRVEAMIQHTRTSQGTRLYKGGVIWHIIKTPPASLTTCNSLSQVWQQLHINSRSNISSVLCKKYTRLCLTDVNSPYSRDLIRCPPLAASTSCRRCCWGSCQPGRHQAWCCSCCSAPLLPASPPAPACSPAGPKPRQKPGNCGIIENLRRIPWEGLSLLIRGTIGAISGSNSKV